LDPREGNDILRGETSRLSLRVDARELFEGTYRCNIIIKDGFNNNLFIPVTVHVIDSAGRPGSAGGDASLLKSYPNPFSHVVSIEFENNKPGFAEAFVYDVYGKKIKTLVSEMIPEGKYFMTWDRKSDNGILAEPGIYFCTMRSGDHRETIKLILTR
jgi:hypothetical protein